MTGANAPQNAPRLRLIRDDLTPQAGVASENRASARLSPESARAIFAARVGEQLEGGHAAILTPERRERLHRLATTLGLRTFDASLVIAQVQDRARCGTISVQTPASSPNPVSPAPPDAARRTFLRAALASLLLATALFIALVRWVLARPAP